MNAPVCVPGQLLGAKRVGAFHVLTLVAPGVPERFRPGSSVAVTVGGARSDLLTRRTLPVHRARTAGAHGGTVEVVLRVPGPAGPAADPGTAWLAAAPSGTPVQVVGPLGRPFALPAEPVACVLVGHEQGSAPLFPLAERLKQRGCAVQVLLGGRDDAHVFGALEARRAVRGVTVATADGSVGVAGTVADLLPGLLERTSAEVVYAAGDHRTLRQVAAVAERHGAWSQTLLGVPMPCGTGLCHGCAVPVVAEDGVQRVVRACVEGPVFRGDRVRWAALEQQPEGAR